jgi:DNA-binding beta-propeller fold protein YncE
VLIADSGNHRIRRIDDDGTLTTLVALVVDQQQPTLSAAQAVAVDDEGRVLIADAMHHRVWRVGSDGALRSIAGTGVFGFSGTGGPAVQAELGAPFGVAVDPLGRVLVVELHHGVVRRIEQDGTLRVVAGTGELAEPCDAAVVDGGPATAALLQAPRGVAVDRQGRVLTADTGSGRVRRVELDGTITTVAGTGTLGLLGDGGPADSAALRFPQDVVVDSEGRLVIADGFHDRLRRVGTDGVITTIAGTGDDLFFRSDVAFVDDLCPASRTGVEFPRAVVVDDVGRVLFIDGSNRIRRIEPDNRIVTVAGTGSFGRAGDGGPATAADLGFPRGLVIDDGGRVIFADTDNHVVRRIDEDGLVHTIAGTGTAAFLGDGGPATSAGLQSPFGLAVDALGRVIVADSGNHAVRRLETDGTITTLAGVGFPGFAVDGGPAETAALQLPRGVAVDADGRVLVAECLNNVVRRIEHDGTLVIVAGTGGRGFSGDGGPARAALFDCPQGLDVDAEGRVIVADTGNHRVRRIERDGTVTTVAGEAHPAGPGPAGRARLYPAEALALLPTHELVAVGGFGRAMRLDLRAGVVDVVVGYEGAAPGVAAQARFAPPLRQSRGAVFDPGALTLLFSERDAPGVRVVDVDVDDDQVIDDPSSWTSRTLSTGLTSPAGFAHDPATDTFVVADDDEHCVQRIDRDGRVLATVLGRCGAAGRLPGFLHRPTHVAVSPVSGALYVADTGNHRVLRKDGDVVTVVVGDGSVSSAGEGSPARLFPVQAPGQLALDRFGNLYVASTTTVRMVANIDGDRDADGDDDVRTLFGGGDRSTYPESDAFCLRALAVDEDAVYVSDACQGFVVRLSPAAQP